MSTETTPHEAEAPDDEIEIVEDAPEAAAPEPAPEPEPKAEPQRPAKAEYSKDVQRRIDRLTAQRHAAEQRAQEAERRAAAAEQAALQRYRDNLTAADASLERDLKNEQVRLRQAIAEGDVDAQVAAQAALAEVATRRAQVQQDVQRVPQQQRQQAAPQFTPKTQAYIDANPWFTDDPDAKATAVRAHEIAVRRGLQPDTQQYFDHVTRVVKAAHPEHFEDADDEPEVEQPRRSPAPPVAAARRTVPGAPAGRITAHLPAHLVELCKQNDWDIKTYTANYIRRQKEEGKS
jgi:hypothetical protein